MTESRYIEHFCLFKTQDVELVDRDSLSLDFAYGSTAGTYADPHSVTINRVEKSSSAPYISYAISCTAYDTNAGLGGIILAHERPSIGTGCRIAKIHTQRGAQGFSDGVRRHVGRTISKWYLMSVVIGYGDRL